MTSTLSLHNIGYTPKWMTNTLDERNFNRSCVSDILRIVPGIREKPTKKSKNANWCGTVKNRLKQNIISNKLRVYTVRARPTIYISQLAVEASLSSERLSDSRRILWSAWNYDSQYDPNSCVNTLESSNQMIFSNVLYFAKDRLCLSIALAKLNNNDFIVIGFASYSGNSAKHPCRGSSQSNCHTM